MNKSLGLEAAWRAWRKSGDGAGLARALAGASRSAARRLERQLGNRLGEVVGAGCREGARWAEELLERARRHPEAARENLREAEREAEALLRERHALEVLFRYLDPRPGRDGAAMGRFRLALAGFDQVFREHLDDFIGGMDFVGRLRARRGFAAWAARRLRERSNQIRTELEAEERWFEPVAEALRGAIPSPAPTPLPSPAAAPPRTAAAPLRTPARPRSRRR